MATLVLSGKAGSLLRLCKQIEGIAASERAVRRREGGGETSEMGYAGIGKGTKSKRSAGTPGGG